MIRSSALVLALSAAALFLTVSTPADSQYIPPSRGCERNSDCADGLICRFIPNDPNRDGGYCTEQCHEDRDCGPGQQCLVNSKSVRSCVLITPRYVPPEAPMCTAPRDCTSGGCSSDNQCNG